MSDFCQRRQTRSAFTAELTAADSKLGTHLGIIVYLVFQVGTQQPSLATLHPFGDQRDTNLGSLIGLIGDPTTGIEFILANAFQLVVNDDKHRIKSRVLTENRFLEEQGAGSVINVVIHITAHLTSGDYILGVESISGFDSNLLAVDQHIVSFQTIDSRSAITTNLVLDERLIGLTDKTRELEHLALVLRLDARQAPRIGRQFVTRQAR